MQKELVAKDAIKLVGLSVRTNNKNEFDVTTAKIGKLWGLFLSRNDAAKIKHRKNPGALLSVYTEYASNEHGDYTYFIGEEVTAFDDVHQDMQQLIIPAAQYQKLTTASGKMPEIVINAWQKIWQMTPDELGGTRAYQADFEVYDARARDPAHTSLDIYIGLK